MINRALDNKRLVLICLITLSIAIGFWSGSRVPALNEKAAMGGDLALEDPLGFEAVFPVDPADPTLQKIAYTTVNWVNTNKQGMAFGLAFAAAIFTLLSLLKTRSFESHFGNTLLGIVIGTPMGVCVNCAAPVAKGLHDAGSRIETTLAALISSPTLNIIVLSMLFAILPLYMALIKVGLTLFILLVAIPLLARYVFRSEHIANNVPTQTGSDPMGITSTLTADIGPAPAGWTGAAVWVVRAYLRNLWNIAKITVPLMFLAGLLGAAVVTLFPWDQIGDMFPDTGIVLSVLGLGALATLGLFLPVPIAFDVVLTTALVSAGLPVKYTMTLLFTLGIFSVYPFMILWRGISRRVAIVLALLFIAFGVLAGILGHLYVQWEEPRERAMFLENFEKFDWPQARPETLPRAANEELLQASLAANALQWESVVEQAANISTERSPLHAPQGMDEQLFTRQASEELGVMRLDHMSVAYKFSPPFYRDWPITTGDIQGDGRPDIVFGTNIGILVYANMDGERFAQQRFEIPELEGIRAMNVALVDLNNDRLPDIFVSAYKAGNHVVFNNNGHFDRDHYMRLPDTAANLANSASFGDLDNDGDIDIVLGNWTAGRWTKLPPEGSRNAILWNTNGEFTSELLPGLPGETLSSLISDINQDGYPDLMIGNDFDTSDMYFLGGAEGLQLSNRSDNIFPHTVFSTMSIDSADIDNDLDLEIYVGQVTARTTAARSDKVTLLEREASCNGLGDGQWGQRCRDRLKIQLLLAAGSWGQNPFKCMEVTNLVERGDCFAYLLMDKAARYDRDPALCERFPEQWAVFADICRVAHLPPPKHPQKLLDESLTQVRDRNVLYVSDGNGRWEDRAEAMNVDVAGWTWNSKFADLDNDEWQDLYIVNGHYRSGKRESNIFYHNEEGKTFSNATQNAGLEDFMTTGTYTYVDFDNDGDLDIIAVTFDGPIWIHRNNTRGANAISFELDDHLGNRTGVGSRIVIHYGKQGKKHQLREIKAGGGFLSTDAPVAHFGLGSHETIERVEVVWSTGERSELSGPFEAGYRYRLTRKDAAS